MFRSPLTPSASLRGISTELAYAAAETSWRRGHYDSVYADIAEFAKQAHRDRHIGPS
jgi:hypothetical protein